MGIIVGSLMLIRRPRGLGVLRWRGRLKVRRSGRLRLRRRVLGNRGLGRRCEFLFCLSFFLLKRGGGMGLMGDNRKRTYGGEGDMAMNGEGEGERYCPR